MKHGEFKRILNQTIQWHELNKQQESRQMVQLCFRGAVLPIDFLAVCLVRAMEQFDGETKVWITPQNSACIFNIMLMWKLHTLSQFPHQHNVDNSSKVRRCQPHNRMSYLPIPDSKHQEVNCILKNAINHDGIL